jgi:hypothetical protein
MNIPSPNGGRLLSCRMHGKPEPYTMIFGVIRPCPWPDCSNGTTSDTLTIGPVTSMRAKIGDRWVWAEMVAPGED